MASLAFERAHANFERSEGNAVVTWTKGYGFFRTAASGAVLKGGGRHMVQLTKRKGAWMYFGLIRADWDVEGGKDAFKVQGHCFYDTSDGKRLPGDSAWEGRQAANEEGDRIGLLLDLDAGSLTVYKNDARLGVMQESGLTDAAGYRWAVALLSKGSSARIGEMPVVPLECRVADAGGEAAFLETLLLKSAPRRMEHSVVAVIGNGRVGKTCLIRALQGQPFDADCKSTEGIDTCQIDAQTWSPGANGEAEGAAGSIVQAAAQEEYQKLLSQQGADAEPEPEEPEPEDAEDMEPEPEPDAGDLESEEPEGQSHVGGKERPAEQQQSVTEAPAAATKQNSEGSEDEDAAELQPTDGDEQEDDDEDEDAVAAKKAQLAAEAEEAARKAAAKAEHEKREEIKAQVEQARKEQQEARMTKLGQVSVPQQKTSFSFGKLVGRKGKRRGSGSGPGSKGNLPAPVVTIFDMAGQRMYYHLHAIMVTKTRTHYVVSISLAEDPHAPLAGEDSFSNVTCLENFHYWLDVIHAMAPNAPITLVATKADLVSQEECQTRLHIIQKSLAGTPYRKQIIGGVIPVSSKSPGDAGIEVVRRDLQENLVSQSLSDEDTEAAPSMKSSTIDVDSKDGTKWQHKLSARPRPGLTEYGREVPLAWFRFHETIVELKKKGTKRLSLDEAREQAELVGIGKDDAGKGPDYELLLMLRTFTDTGVVKHADEPGIRDVIIIDLQWLVDTLCQLLSYRSICRAMFRARLAEVVRHSCMAASADSERRQHTAATLARNMFSLFDVDGNGEVSKDELREVLSELGQNPTEVELLSMISTVAGETSQPPHEEAAIKLAT
eukprot:COSAG06_NODE_6383_length_2956_cov_29.742387_2_plen_832_part_01